MLPILKMIRRGLVVHAGPRDQRLSLLHVDDLANAIAAWLLVSRRSSHKTYAIDDGTPGGYGWEKIGEAVSTGGFRTLTMPRFILGASARINLLLSSLLGYSPMLTPGKVRELIQPDWLCDNSDFSDISGWEPRLDLKQGVQQLFQTESRRSGG
jgi:nucleoside-diphosphate-sugar epimerase